MPNETFGSRLTRLREAARKSQGDLAAIAGISRQSINLLESDQRQPTWETVQALADALGVSTEAFRLEE